MTDNQTLADKEKDATIAAYGELVRALNDLLNPPCKEPNKSNHGANQADIALKAIVKHVNGKCRGCDMVSDGTCLYKSCKLFAVRKILSKPE